MYTHYVRSATQFDALKRAQTTPLPEQSASEVGSFSDVEPRPNQVRSSLNNGHVAPALPCPEGAN